jgi:GSH-dependent disulfide-bond oxidoreductase
VARVAVLEWLMFQMGSFEPMPGQVHRFMAETRRLYAVMDRRLAEHAYFAGTLSIADFAIVGWVWRHERHLVDLADFPQVRRWYEAMMTRPGVVRGFAVQLRHTQ